MSKWWPPRVALDAIQAAMKIHGNLGYSTELPLQQRHRDVMAYLVADGTAEAGARSLTLVPCSPSWQAGVDAVAEVRSRLLEWPAPP